MNKQNILQQTQHYVHELLKGETTGHDWWHIQRVRKTALHIAKQEKADLFIVELAALFHDVTDRKLSEQVKTLTIVELHKKLVTLQVDANTIKVVCNIIQNISFLGAKVAAPKMQTIEGMVVQDADRLDAMGAIGIARTFAYGGYTGRLIYDPHKKHTLHDKVEDYFNDKGSTINHFYEKLLLLKDRMNTKTGSLLAKQRHDFMQAYLQQFFAEWNIGC